MVEGGHLGLGTLLSGPLPPQEGKVKSVDKNVQKSRGSLDASTIFNPFITAFRVQYSQDVFFGVFSSYYVHCTLLCFTCCIGIWGARSADLDDDCGIYGP